MGHSRPNFQQELEPLHRTAPSQVISVIPYLDDWLVHHLDCQVLLFHQSHLHLSKFRHMVGFINTKKSELDLVQDIQFLRICLRLDLGRALLPESKAQEIAAGACRISSQPVLSYHQVSQSLN